MDIKEAIGIIKELELIQDINEQLKFLHELIYQGRMDRKELKLLCEKLIPCQLEDGSFCTESLEGMPGSERVYYVYFPTFYITGIMMRAYLMGYASELPQLKESLKRGLEAAIGRKLKGHGFSQTQELFDALEIYFKSGVMALFEVEPDFCEPFWKVILEHLISFRLGLIHGRTFSDYNRNFRDEFEKTVDYFDHYKLKLFVYGTLKKGFLNHKYMKGSKFLGEGTIKQYEYSIENYLPAIVPGDGLIAGEIYQLEHKDTLICLDELEGYGYLYRRELVGVTTKAGERMLAFVYVLKE